MVLHMLEDNRKPTTMEKFGNAFGNANKLMSQALAMQMQKENEQQKLSKENEAAKRFGVDLSGISDPKLREKFIESKLKGDSEIKKQEAKYDAQFKMLEKLGYKFDSDENPLPQPKNIENESIITDKKPYSQQRINAMALVNPAAADKMQKYNDQIISEKNRKEDVQFKKFESDRAYHSKLSDPILQEAEEVLKTSPTRKALINQQRRDIRTGETSGIIPYLVDTTGLEAYRTPEAARFKTVTKQRFIEGLNSLGGGARPNQFLEQQLMSAQPAIGRDVEANETVLDLDEFIDDMKTERARLIRQISSEDEEKFGFTKRDVGARADQMMEKYAEKRQDQMANDIRMRKENNMSNEQLVQELVSKNIMPDTPLTKRMASILMIKNHDDAQKAYAEAKSLGFRIPKD